MPFALGSFGRVFESMLYSDELVIYRRDMVTIGDGTSRMTQVNLEHPVQSGVPCKISFKSIDTQQGQMEDLNKKNVVLTVFCPANVDVMKGDYLVLHRIDDLGNVVATYQGNAGLPAQFVTHKEIVVEDALVV